MRLWIGILLIATLAVTNAQIEKELNEDGEIMTLKVNNHKILTPLGIQVSEYLWLKKALVKRLNFVDSKK